MNRIYNGRTARCRLITLETPADETTRANSSSLSRFRFRERGRREEGSGKQVCGHTIRKSLCVLTMYVNHSAGFDREDL